MIHYCYIYFDAENDPGLAIGSFFNLTAMSFWNDPAILWALPYFLAQNGEKFILYFPSPSPESDFSKKKLRNSN